MEEFDFKVFEGASGGYIAFAKRGKITAQTIQEAMSEMGDVWFNFGSTHEDALSKVKREVLN